MSEWNDWLREIKRAGLLADENAVPLAFRGYRWVMEVALEGDYSGYQVVGRIKASPDASTDLAVMEVVGPVIHEGQTLWELSLPGSGGTYNTNDLPADNNLNGVERFPFMLTMVPPAGAAPYPLVAGIFTLAGAV